MFSLLIFHSNHLSGMLFCSSELGFKEVYDWMVIDFSITFEFLIAYQFLIFKPNIPLNCEIAVQFFFRLQLHFLLHGGLFNLLMVSSVQYTTSLVLTYLVSFFQGAQSTYSVNFGCNITNFDECCLLRSMVNIYSSTAQLQHYLNNL